jgi:hypothetical protein
MNSLQFRRHYQPPAHDKGPGLIVLTSIKHVSRQPGSPTGLPSHPAGFRYKNVCRTFRFGRRCRTLMPPAAIRAAMLPF